MQKCLLAFSCVLLIQVFHAQIIRGDEFPKLYNSEADQEAAPMKAKDAARGFEVPAGFKVEVFAHEPDVQNPIAMTWDTGGRLWIAENYTYAERAQKFDLALRDRVVILEDTDQDGQADVRTVFTDQVQMLTSIEVGHGGVWLMCPPRLLFIPDADRDGKPDGPAVVKLDGFEVAKENYHNFANGLRWGPDGWLYGRCGGSCPGRIGVPGSSESQRTALEGGIWRYHPYTQQVDVLTHGTTNPWGHDWDEFGECFFINTVNGHLWHLIPGGHLDRPFTLDPNPHVYQLLDMHADHWHFDTKGTWTDSRDGAANAFGGGHAHTGMMIYLGSNWPTAYRGRLLTFNIHGRRANQELLERQGSGYVGRHGADMLLAADLFFRGNDLRYGPDGAVYLIDWSDTGECHEHTGVHRTSGRVFRVSYGDQRPASFSDLHDLDDLALAKLMRHGNEWYVRQARLVLAERGRNESGVRQRGVEALQDLLNDPNAVHGFRGLTSLHAAGLTAPQLLQNLLEHPHEHLRVWAIRCLTDGWPLDDVLGPRESAAETAARVKRESDQLLPVFRNMAANDSSSLVRLALASVLQRLPVESRALLAAPLMRRQEDANDHNLPLLVWYGLIPVAEKAPSSLADLALLSKWPQTQRFIVRRLAAGIDHNAAAVDRLLHAAVAAPPANQQNLLQGLSAGLRGWTRAAKPASWDRFAKSVSTGQDRQAKQLAQDLSILFGDGRALSAVRTIVMDQDADISVRRTALETLIERRDSRAVEICLSLISDRRLNAVAAKGVAQSAHDKVAQALITNYRRFRAPQRPGIIEILVSRPNFAHALLDAVEGEKIPVDDLTAYDVRQIRSLQDPQLQDRIRAVWGAVRDTSEAKRARMASLKMLLSEERLSVASPSRGRILFEKSCARCHRLFGNGEGFGVDLTGANRNNLDYLLDNIVDPGAVVSKGFRMTIVETNDGRVLNGLVANRTPKTLTLQTQTDRMTIAVEEIAELRRTPQSPMPDGLLDNLSDKQIGDLISYLMQPAQVELPENAQATAAP